MFLIYIAFVALALFTLHRNKDLLVPIVIIAAIFGCGPAIAGRYLLDEIVIISAIFFVALTSWRDFWHRIFALRRNLTRLDALFFAFLFYYVIQSVRTFLAVHEASAFIYGAYFMYLGGLYVVLRAYGLTKIGETSYSLGLYRWRLTLEFAQILIVAVIAYNVTYIAQGCLAEFTAALSGSSSELPARFATQGISWSGSAYAVLPNLLMLVLAPKVFPRRSRLFLVWLGSLIAVAFAYDSRVALALSIIAGCFAAATSFRFLWRQLLIIVLLGAIAGVAFVGDLGRMKKTVFDAASGLAFLLNPRIEKSIKEGDYDRYAHFYAGFRAINQDPETFLFGYGMMMHRVVIGQYIVEIFMENPDYRRLYLASKDEEATAAPNTDVTESGPDRNSLFLRGSRSTSFTSMLIDGGAIGLLLMFANLLIPFVVTLRSLRGASVSAYGITLLGAALFAAWPIIIFLLDVTLYALFLMPCFLPALMACSTDPKPSRA